MTTEATLLTAAIAMLVASLLFAGRLRERLAVMEERLERIEQKRHTHYTLNRLEDAIAVLVGAEFDADAMLARIETAKRLLGETRNRGPHGKKEEG